MSIVEMQKIHILALKQQRQQLLKCLEKNEVLDIQALNQGEKIAEELGRYEYQLAEIKSAISFLESVSPKKKGFVESFIPAKEIIGEQELGQLCRQFDCPDFLKKCSAIENELANLKNLKNEILTKIDKMIPWRSLTLPLNSLYCPKKICFFSGSIKNKQFQQAKEKLAETNPATEINIVSRNKEETFVIITYLASDKKTIEDFISKTAFNQIQLPELDKTPAAEIAQLKNVLKQTKVEIKSYVAEAKELAGQVNKLKYMHDYILGEKTQLEIKQKFVNTRYSFVIEGWVKKADLTRLKSELEKITSEIEIYLVAPAKGEKPPVALKNPAAFSPFELITKIYGTPKYTEWDPSVPLSFFFALFFGICLGDFGYGVILMLAAIYFLKRYRLPQGGVNLFRLLIFGGAVAALVGLLTGSYLGFNPAELPPNLTAIKSLLSSIQIIDPIKSPLVMLLFSLALGVIQILFGIMLQLALKLKNRDYLGAILDDGLWLFFLGSLVFLIVASALNAPTKQLASYLSLSGAGLLVLTQGRHKKNIIQKFLSGLLSLYKVSGYMGDTLSYSRLLALGMSTTIIGSVINILAGMVKGGVPGLGILLMIILLVIGHIFNLIIGTLGAFVHSTRLQMVEFFSKFYEGGGREFRPYKREAEYTILK